MKKLIICFTRWWGWKVLGIPKKPQPCPHCGIEIEAAWVEGSGDNELFFVCHADPVCFAGSKRLRVAPLTIEQIRAFRFWTHNLPKTK